MSRLTPVAAFVLGQACLCYNFLLPDAPGDGAPVWRVARADATTEVYQLTEPTGKWFGPQRRVSFEYSLSNNTYDGGLLCYIDDWHDVDKDTLALAFDHIEAKASKNKPIKLAINFEYGCYGEPHKQLKNRGYADDTIEYYNEFVRSVMSKRLA